MVKKLFTEKQAAIAAIIAGPVPAGILIFLNFRTLEKDKEAIVSLAFTLFFSAFIFYILFSMPDEVAERIPSFFFTGLYGLLVYLFFKRSMSEDIQHEFEKGAEKRSGWTVAGITLIGLILSIAVLAGIAADQQFYEGELVELKGNELYFDAEIPEPKVNAFLLQLESSDFFSEGSGNVARLELIADEYFITLVIDEELWSDPDVISSATSIKWLMEVEYKKKTHMKLASISLTGDTKLKYIDN